MRSTKKKNIASVLFASGALLISGLISGCGKDSDATAQNRDNFRSDTVAVQTQEVKIRDFSRSFRATGTLVARQRAMLRTIVGGLISDVPVDVGDRVEEGDLLMQIREIDYELVLEQTEADLARANAQLEQAEREQERTQRLYENGTASEQDLDQAMTAYNEAQAARLQAVAGRNTAQQNLEDASIRAPYNGVITEREFEPREFASSGEAAIEILNLELLEAELEIPEKYLGLVEDSSQVLVEFESGFEPRTGTIVAISPKVGEETRSFRIRVQVRNDDLELPSGQFISTIMELRNVTDQIAIPQNALVRRDGQSFVWVYNEGIAERRPIREGIQEEQWVLIQNGVRQGEKVITEGKNGLNDNYPVREVSGSN
ncbi:MAG: efflux RND transporter periplasmic adaptor subunit [Gracilimonas sp.]